MRDNFLILMVIALAVLTFFMGYSIGTPSQSDLEAAEEQVVSTPEAIRFGIMRGSYETTVILSQRYNLPRGAYLAWEYGICEGYGEKYLVMLGGATGDSTWLKQFIDGTICEECRSWYEANQEMARPLDSSDTLISLEGWR